MAPAAGPQKLGKDTILLGQDSWADGRLGDYANSRVVLNDSRMIADLFQAKIISKYQLLDKMQQLADADAKKLEKNLFEAIVNKPKKIITLIHVPPFKETCMYEGKISNDDWLPYFSSKIIGDVLIKFSNKNPDIEFQVLCGHTHSEAHYRLDNLTVRAGMAKYYQPIIQKLILI